jgi:hypothetical protein
MITNMDFTKIAPYLTHPLVLVGFSLFLLVGLLKNLIKSGIVPEVSKEAGAGIVRLFLDHSFIIILIIVLLGFLLQGLQNHYTHVEIEGTAIKKTYDERAEAAFSAVLNELGSNVGNIGLLVSAIEDNSSLQPFEKYEKRRVNETELAYRERAKNHYRDYYSNIKSFLEKFPISDSTWKAHQNDLLTSGENNISKFRSTYGHVNSAMDYLKRYVENVQEIITLDYSDPESYSKISSERAEKIASVKFELCNVVATVALLAHNNEELFPFQFGLEQAGIKDAPLIQGNEGASLLIKKSIEFQKDKSKAISEAIPKLNAAADTHISTTINDPYLKLLRRTIGKSESLTEADIYHLKIKKLDPEDKDFSKLLGLAYISYFEADGENAIVYLERATKIKGLPNNIQNYLNASIHRLRNPDEFGESLGFMIMDIDKRGLFAKSGFQLKDILISIDDKPLIEPTDISSSLAHNSDHPFLIRLVRNGRKMELAVKPGKSAGATITQLVAFGQVRL